MLDRVLLAVVAAVAIVVAGAMLADYLANPDLLWSSFYHDRNTHFAFGLDLALATRELDPLWFLSELDKAKVWPPLHGLALAAVLLLAGPDHRWAIVPSLIGWVATVVFGALTARALFKDRAAGVLAAAVTATLTIASPALRLLASDVMLEGMGSGLSAAAIWSYGIARSDPSARWKWRLLAIILTALFFEKGNYWGLVAASLIAASLSVDARWWSALARATVVHLLAHPPWRAIARDPLLIACTACVATVIYLYARGPTAAEFLGRQVSLYPPENLTTLAYALLFIRVTWAIYRHRAGVCTHLGVAGRELVAWHLAPLAVSFLLPRRLSAFLWFVGPANRDWQSGYDPVAGLHLYAEAFVAGFHLAPWAAALATVLAMAAAFQFRRLPPAGRAALMLVAVSSVAVLIHPQHQPRFLASWIFSLWICAGAGAGLLFERFAAKLSWPLLAIIVAGAITTLVAGSLWQSPSRRAAFDAARADGGTSDLDLVRPYLAELDGAHVVMFATTFGMSKLFQWMLREHCRCKIIVEDPGINGAQSREQVRDMMADLASRSRADVLVVIDAPTSPYSLAALGWIYDKMAGIPEAMAQQTRFVQFTAYALPGLGARATLWRKVERTGARGDMTAERAAPRFLDSRMARR